MTQWQPIETAPKDGTIFMAKIDGHGSDNLIAWHTDDDVGQWTFMTEAEPPNSWTDGYCWEVNEDGEKSSQPTHWKPWEESGGE